MVTKRTKNLKKQEIPSLDDPIGMLDNVGKETQKKLQQLQSLAQVAGIDLSLQSHLHRYTWDPGPKGSTIDLRKRGSQICDQAVAPARGFVRSLNPKP